MARTRTDYHLQGYWVAWWLLAMRMLCAVHAECNLCAVGSEQACVSETDFRFCVDGAMVGSVYPCPASTVCNLNGSCTAKADDVISPCAVCDQCDRTNTFVCKGPRQFALCLGTGLASNIVGECGAEYVCNIDYRYICAAVDEGNTPSCAPTTEAPVTEPTTTTTTTTTTTPSPSGQPTVYCNYVKERGRFPVGTDPETTCRQYLLCMERNEAWIGALYYCPNRLYFDDATRSCSSSTPARCSGRVRSLSIFDISLN